MYRFNSGEHIDEIVDKIGCDRHRVAKGVPCFEIRYNDGRGKPGPAVCGSRIKKAGFNGKINPISISRTKVRN